jgi:hypothetical protein
MGRPTLRPMTVAHSVRQGSVLQAPCARLLAPEEAYDYPSNVVQERNM